MSNNNAVLLRSDIAILVDPQLNYKDSYITMLREHQAKGRFLDSRHIDNRIVRIERDFSAFIDSLQASHDPLRLRPGRIPERHFWLIADNEVVGRSTLRPELSDAPEFRNLGHIGYDVRPSAEGQGFGKRALRLTLEAARRCGLKRALLTCDSTNIGSKRIIEACDGNLERSVPIAGRAYERMRYWISLP